MVWQYFIKYYIVLQRHQKRAIKSLLYREYISVSSLGNSSRRKKKEVGEAAISKYFLCRNSCNQVDLCYFTGQMQLCGSRASSVLNLCEQMFSDVSDNRQIENTTD